MQQKLAPICNTYLFLLQSFVVLTITFVRKSHPSSHVTNWSYHLIYTKGFISTFARAIVTNFSKVWLKFSWSQQSSHMTHLSRDHAIFAKRYIFSFTAGYELGWRCPTYSFKKLIDHVTTCFLKNSMYPLTQGLRTQLEIPNLESFTIQNRAGSRI